MARYLTWGEHASAVITESLAKSKSDGLTPKETIKAVDAAYPFGERHYWPYKAWLKARRKLCAGLPGVKPLPQKTRKSRMAISDDTKDMFGVNE